MNTQDFTFENRFFPAYSLSYVFVVDNRVRLNEPDGNIQTFYFADNDEAQQKADSIAQYFDGNYDEETLEKDNSLSKEESNDSSLKQNNKKAKI